MFFEWDSNKDRLNYCKHGLHFKDAILVFKDEYRIEGNLEELENEEISIKESAFKKYL